MKMTLPHIGMRMVKTGVSVLVCLLIAQLCAYPSPVFACVAAIIVTKDTIENSFKQGIDRVVSTLVGGAIAIVILLWNIDVFNPYLRIAIVALGCILTLYFCVVIKSPDAAALACVVFLSIVLQHPQDKYIFALTRIAETVAGIVVSLTVNRFFRWPPIGPRKQDTADADSPQ